MKREEERVYVAYGYTCFGGSGRRCYASLRLDCKLAEL